MKKGLIATILIIAIGFSIGAALYIKTPLGDMVSQLIDQWIGGSEDDEPTSYDDIVASDYIHISNYQKKLDIHLDNFYDYRQAEFDTQIAKILNTYKPEEPYVNTDESYVPKITVGDTVEIFYRGYLLNEDGTRNYIDAGSNIEHRSVPQAHYLTIGSHNFIAGFEIGMMGKSLADYPTLEFITEGQVNSDSIIYISYTRYKIEGEKSIPDSATSRCIDLSAGKELIDNKYGAGFYDFLLFGNGGEGQPFGKNLITYDSDCDPSFMIGDTEYIYKKIKIEYATAPFDYDKYTVLEVRFPVDYHSELSCQNSYWEIYVQGITEYYDDSEGEVVFNDEFLFANDKKALIGLAESYTENKPLDFEKRYPSIIANEERRVQYMLDDLAAKYPYLSTISERYSQYVWDEVTEEYEATMSEKIDEAILDYYRDNTTIIKYPEKIRESKATELRERVQKDYELYTEIFDYSPEDYSIEQFVSDFSSGGGFSYRVDNDVWQWVTIDFNIPIQEGETLDEAIYRIVEEEIVTNLIIHYIAEKEKLDFSDSALEAGFKEMIANSLDFDRYVEDYLKENADQHLAKYDGCEEELEALIANYVKEDTYNGYIDDVAKRYIVLENAKNSVVRKVTFLD